MYRAYIPEHRDFKKNIAKLEVEKLASTTYGLDYLKVTDIIDFRHNELHVYGCNACSRVSAVAASLIL